MYFSASLGSNRVASTCMISGNKKLMRKLASTLMKLAKNYRHFLTGQKSTRSFNRIINCQNVNPTLKSRDLHPALRPAGMIFSFPDQISRDYNHIAFLVPFFQSLVLLLSRDRDSLESSGIFPRKRVAL